MKSENPKINTPNRVAKFLIEDALDRAYYYHDNNIRHGANDGFSGLMAGYVQMTLSEKEVHEVKRHLDKHVNAILKRLGQ